MTSQDLSPKIRATLLNLLSRREHTETELLQKLQAKGYPFDETQKIIHQLTAEGLINPERFLENYIYSRRARGFGPLRIRAELIERGLKEESIEHHLNMPDNEWFAVARAVWQKRFKGQKPKDFKGKAQQMRFLNYRGFTPEHIESIFNNDDE